MTLEAALADPVTNAVPINCVIVEQMIMPLNKVEEMATGLLDFIEQMKAQDSSRKISRPPHHLERSGRILAPAAKQQSRPGSSRPACSTFCNEGVRSVLFDAGLGLNPLESRARSSARVSGSVRRYADFVRAPGLASRGPSYGVCVAPFSLRGSIWNPCCCLLLDDR